MNVWESTERELALASLVHPEIEETSLGSSNQDDERFMLRCLAPLRQPSPAQSVVGTSLDGESQGLLALSDL